MARSLIIAAALLSSCATLRITTPDGTTVTANATGQASAVVAYDGGTIERGSPAGAFVLHGPGAVVTGGPVSASVVDLVGNAIMACITSGACW